MWKLLVVDDEPANLNIVRQILRDDYEIVVVKNGKAGLEAVDKHNPDLILLDVMMPEMDGYEMCRRLKESVKNNNIPVIFITAMGETEDEEKGFDLGAVDYITKPFKASILKARVATHLSLYDQNRALEAMVAQRTQEIHITRLKVIQRLGRAAEYKDNETGYHVIRMSNYAKLIALEAGFSPFKAELFMNATHMHDVGKIGIPDHILQKPGPLDDREWNIMRTHPKLGAEIIGDDDSELLKQARRIAFNHHEKWDGSGYPQRLSGDDIPIEARIVAIADVFDALTTVRPYKPAWSLDETLEYMRTNEEKHFDPNLLDIFLNKIPEVLAIMNRWRER